MLTETERRVLDQIDERALVETLGELLAVPSVGGTPGELRVQRVAAQLLEREGLAVELAELDLAALLAHPRFPGSEVERTAALAVQGTLGAGDGRRLVFNGHLDVVPAGDESAWASPPWRAHVAGGRVYGRGACDMKGGVAALIHAAGAIRRAGVQLRGTLAVQTVIGEEDGGLGSFAAGLRWPGADGAVIAEPTELRPVLAQAGALTFRLRVVGRAAHGALRAEGHSALDAYLPLHRALAELERERNSAVEHPLMRALPLPYPISVGMVRAGEWSSTVPEQLVAEGRYGVRVGEPVEQARAALERAVAATTAADPWLCANPPALEWWGGQFDSAVIAADHPLAQTLSGALADQNRDTAPAGVSYGSDMRLLQHIGGTPALLCGPGDVRLAHQRDESIPIADLLAAARVYALTALRFLGVQE
ncbi:MAG TPA: ArgE/DapE family deacylase [Roseiflexaceae bacterium]|nr:ArgE/DapE family deacylase [Roseiflexaceae bacterium]